MSLLKKHTFSPLFALTIAGIFFFTACKKEQPQQLGANEDGQVTFICASPQLINDLGTDANALILVDIADTAYKPLNINDLPKFNQYYGYLFPTSPFNAKLPQSWLYYMHLKSGLHTITLVDTGHYMRVRDQLNLQPKMPVSIYYTDSLGFYKSVILQDQLINEPANVRLRFINLSPDAGNVFFTINDKPASQSGFIKQFKYGQTTPFVSYPNPKTDTLRINYYQASDSTTVIASTFLQAIPGRSYTLALNGYYNQSVTYPDPKNGKIKSLTGNLSVLMNINN